MARWTSWHEWASIGRHIDSAAPNLNGTAMAINARSDMTRPLTLGLIGLAVVSWLITFLLFIYRAEDQRDHRRQVRMLQANEAEVRTQLTQQTSASGTLSDLQARIAAAQHSWPLFSRASWPLSRCAWISREIPLQA